MVGPVFRIQPKVKTTPCLRCFLAIAKNRLWYKSIFPPRDGDKRVILVNGEPVGAVNRIPNEGGPFKFPRWWHRGRSTTDGVTNTSALSSARIKTPRLLFIGVDIIGDYLTEINVTSPTE